MRVKILAGLVIGIGLAVAGSVWLPSLSVIPSTARNLLQDVGKILRFAQDDKGPGAPGPLTSSGQGAAQTALGGLRDWRKGLSAKAETFQISQEAGRWPKIIQATIDPPDVHVGDTQTLTIILEDPVEITSVEAKTELDHGSITIPLKLVGEAARGEILPPRIAVGEGGKVIALNDVIPAPSVIPAKAGIQDLSSVIPSLLEGTLTVLKLRGPSTALRSAQDDKKNNIAAAADLTGRKLKYQATWKVKDTHNIKYHTTFTVKDSAGRVNEITLAWSDLCLLPNNGDWALSSNGPSGCTLSGQVDGVDNGNATIDNYTLTLSNGSTFAFNSGKSITMSGGTIAISGNSQIKQTYLWENDGDGDVYPSGNLYAQDSNPGAGYAHKYEWANPVDCNDANINIWADRSNLAQEHDGDGYYTGSATSFCAGAPQPGNITNSQYYKDWGASPGSQYWYVDLGTPNNGSGDCDDLNVNIFRTIAGLRESCVGQGPSVFNYGGGSSCVDSGLPCSCNKYVGHCGTFYVTENVSTCTFTAPC